jgi:[ribosomal protein S5]-alanine N-acetyltransferase
MKAVLETERLILREMTEDDADNLVALARNPNVTRYIPGEPPVNTREEALVVLRERIFPQYRHSVGRWACIVKATGEFIGWCGVKHLPENAEYDIGYRFLEPQWGKGYATEAARATLLFSRQHLAAERVVGRAMPENLASVHVLEKIGLVYEGEVEEEGVPLKIYVMR